MAQEILLIARGPTEQIDMGRFSELIGTDPTLTIRVLHLANSPYYGTQRRITSVRHAISLLGLRESVDFLLWALLRGGTPEPAPLPHFAPEEHWTHSLACAAVSRALASHALVQSLPGDLHLAGLLHDIGKLVLAVSRPAEYSKALQLAHEQGIALHAAEQEVLGEDHAAAGRAALTAWKLPDRVLDAIAHHHCPDQAPPEARELASLVQLGSCLANCVGARAGTTDAGADVAATWIATRGNPPLDVDGAAERLVEQAKVTLERERARLSIDESALQGASAPAHPREAAPAGMMLPRSGLIGWLRRLLGR